MRLSAPFPADATEGGQLLRLEELFLDLDDGHGRVGTDACGSRTLFKRCGALEIVRDDLPENVTCVHVRSETRPGVRLGLALPEGVGIEQSALGGWLLSQEGAPEQLYWVPVLPRLRSVDGHNRILWEREANTRSMRIGRSGNRLEFDTEKAGVLDLVAVRFSGSVPGWQLEFSQATAAERTPYFLWGSHVAITCAADVFNHLLHGAIFDARWAWPHRRKSFSENEAHAIYRVCAMLEGATGKRIYRALQQLVVLAVLSRQEADGAWRHGTWTSGMECHIRLHTSALHLMMDEYERTGEPVALDALRRGARFLAGQHDTVAGGTWFLHDSLEADIETIRQAPFGWVASTALGKRVSNMLVLNTHLDAAIALTRYRRVSGECEFAGLVESAVRVAEQVLSLRSAEWLYRLLFAAINLSLEPAEERRKASLLVRAVRRLGWRYLVPLLPHVKGRFPRFVMPGGYIDRELCMRGWAIDYHSINLMDLARFVRLHQSEIADKALREGAEFVAARRLGRRWLEMAGKEYAIGFWTEALYHLCSMSPNWRYRQWLAEAMIACQRAGIGYAPSLSGTNPEAVPLPEQASCPQAAQAGIWVANLSTAARRELLVVNVTDEPIRMEWLDERTWATTCQWRLPDGEAAGRGTFVLPPNAWLSGSA
jgi:hypothetical protein